MKALSFRQPWANLIVEGRKSLDLRTWNTNYRGPLVVYASLEVEKDACRLHGIDIGMLTTGALIGVVDLVDVTALDEAAYHARAAEHLNGRPWRDGLYGWVLKNPRLIDPPQVVRGRLNLFEVEIQPDVESQKSKLEPVSLSTDFRPSTFDPQPATASEFELHVISDADGKYRLRFAQTLAEKDQPMQYRPATGKTRVDVELGGDALRALADVILETLRHNGYKITDLSASRREPFHLDETSGVRLGLIFLAVKPISKTGRIEQISQGVRVMTGEELFYWYSKCTTGAATERAQKALRLLLANE